MKEEDPDGQDRPGLEGGDLTACLKRWNAGDKTAAEEVLQLVYDQLRRIAAAYLRRERPDHTLQATAVVHEAYIRVFHEQEVHWRDRAHFLGAASRVMREILIDYARSRNRDKRRVDSRVPWLGGRSDVRSLSAEDILALDESLTRLASIDERKARVVEAHFFGGMTVNETSSYLSIPRTTVVRDLKLAKGWIYEQLAPQDNGG